MGGRKKGKASGRYTSTKERLCEICGDQINVKAWGSHRRMCERNAQDMRDQALAEEQLVESRKRGEYPIIHLSHS